MFTVTIVFFGLLTLCEAKSYRNHALLRGVPTDYNELVFFKNLDLVYNVTWWKRPTLINNPVDFSIGPRSLGQLYRDTDTMDIRFRILMKDIQSAFDMQTGIPYVRRNMRTYNWRNYYPLEDIYDWLRDVSSSFPKQVQLRRIGLSLENRTILAARLTLRGSDYGEKVIVEGGCHAREWISPAFVTYMLHTLLHARTYQDEQLERVANMYTWIFVPVMNPDGYEYSHTTDRLWRKNRRDGHGVDLNRNYGIAFGTHSISTIPENPEYCGEAAFSEPESYLMASFAREHKARLKYYLSFHSYGQYIVIPYAHVMEHNDNYDEVKEMAERATRRMATNHKIQFKVGNSFETTGYLASGMSADWVKRALSTRYVVSIELPDKGDHGFALPPDRILPVCQATMDGLIEFLTPPKPVMRTRKNGTAVNEVYIRLIIVCNMFLYVMRNQKNWLYCLL